MRFRLPPGANRTAAMSGSAAAHSTAPGAPTRSSRGIRSQQRRLRPEIGGIDGGVEREARREMAMVMTRPPRKGQRGERVNGQHQRKVARGVVETHLQTDQDEQRGDRTQRGDDGLTREERAGRDAIQPPACHVGEHAACAEPEQGNRDRQKGEVVIHDDRKNAGERELGHQERSGNERHARKGATRWRCGRHHRRESTIQRRDAGSIELG